MSNEPVTAHLGEATILVAPTYGDLGGMQDVGLRDAADLGAAFDAIEALAETIRSKLARASPDRTKVELSIGFAVQSGRLLAMLGDASADGAIKLTMEWSSDSGEVE